MTVFGNTPCFHSLARMVVEHIEMFEVDSLEIEDKHFVADKTQVVDDNHDDSKNDSSSPADHPKDKMAIPEMHSQQSWIYLARLEEKLSP